jgi:hypothetical protein
MELINCLCNVIGAIYPIIRDMTDFSKKKKAACDGPDHKRSASQEQG